MLNPIRIGESGLKRLLWFLWARKWQLAFGFALPSLVLSWFLWAYLTSGCDNNLGEARIQMGNIKQSLDMFYTRADPHVYPDKLQQLVDENIMQEVPKDPWGEPYIYVRASRATYVLLSEGPDQEAGTEDDIRLGGM